MAALFTNSPGCARRLLVLRFRALAPAIVLFWAISPRFAKAQSMQGNGSNANAPSSVHGTVLNRITHEPISRALVYSDDQQYATLTDDRGHFEFKLPPPEPEPVENPATTPDTDPLRARQVRWFRNSMPKVFQARKPGFLQNARNPSYGRAVANQSEMTIYLDPESLIVGYVNLPGSAADLRIHLELYRPQRYEGQEHWEPAGTFTTWADGEFRFCDLAPGTYKLVTLEQLDRDPFTFTPGEQLFGFAPTFYPGASDFSAASDIQLAPGQTFQANISLTRREYYTVKIPVANGAAGQPINIRIDPQGHPGPGYSLGFNPAEQLIQGMLPDGNYTLLAETQGQPGSTGILNFSVHGVALEGPPLNLIPNPSLTVNVKEEFKSGQSVFDNGPADPFDGPSNSRPLRRINVQVILTPIEEFGSTQGAASQPVEGTQEHALMIPNVRPGRYRVRVESGVGFAASVFSGAADLLQEPLVVGMGGSSSPIEVTLRDDGAEVTGQVEGASQVYVFFLPVPGSSGQFRAVVPSSPDGSFIVEQLPPGTYQVLAFDGVGEGFVYPNQEALRNFESKGQIIHVVAGQKERLRLKIISRGDLQ
jgi:hypothetical protein